MARVVDLQVFESLSALAATLKGSERQPDAGASSGTDRPFSWDGGLSLEAITDALAAGGRWDEGAEKLMGAHEMATAATSLAPLPLHDLDATGYAVDVPEFLAGSPEHWWGEGDQDDSLAPVVRLGVSVARAANLEADQIINRGAAILTVVDQLEAAGQRVEITAIYDAGLSSTQCDFRVVVKHSHQHWNAATVAMALCHPAYSRRAMFMLMESSPKVWRQSCGGYGGTTTHIADLGEFDVWIPRAEAGHKGRLSSPEGALRFIQAEFSGQMAGDN